MWCRRWRLAVNGSKTEVLPLNFSHEDLIQINLNGENGKNSKTTKSLVLEVDSKLNYKQQTDISVAKATRNWHILRKHCSTKWSFTLLSLVYLYLSVMQPQVLHGAPIWAQKNIKPLQLFQNNFPRSIFKTCLSPPISTAEALTGMPPIDLFCESLVFKFFFKTKQKNDVIQAAHNQAITQNHSNSCVLESFRRRYCKVTNTSEFFHTPESISAYPNTLWLNGWKSPLADAFLKTFIHSKPAVGKPCQLIRGIP